MDGNVFFSLTSRPTSTELWDIGRFRLSCAHPTTLLQRLEDVLRSRWRNRSQTAESVGEEERDPANPTFLRYQYNPHAFESPEDPFCSSLLARVPVHTYVERLLTYLCPGEPIHDVVPVALRLIDRYHTATRGTITNRNVHLIFGVAMMTAVKLACESNATTTQYFAAVLGITAEALRTLEVILLFECRWNLFPTAEEYAWYADLLVASSEDTRVCDTFTSIFPSPSDTRSVDGMSSDTLGLSVNSFACRSCTD